MPTPHILLRSRRTWHEIGPIRRPQPPKEMTETEKSDLGNPDQVFTRSITLDGLNRQVTETDGSGNITRYAYDSRVAIVVRDANGNFVANQEDGELDDLLFGAGNVRLARLPGPRRA